MDWQSLLNIGTGTVITLVGWFAKSTRDQAARQEKDLTEFRIEVAKNYVTHTDLADIKNTLFRIETKLDAKADK